MYKMLKKKAENASIKGKINLAVGCLAIALSVVSVIGSTGIIFLRSNVREYQKVEKVNSAVTDCRISLNAIARNLREMVIDEDISKVSYRRDEIEKFRENSEIQLQVIKESGYVSDETLNGYLDLINQWYQTGDKILNAVNSASFREAEELVRQECSPALLDLITQVELLTSEIQAVADREAQFSQLIGRISLIK